MALQKGIRQQAWLLNSKRYFAAGCRFRYDQKFASMLSMVQEDPTKYRVGATRMVTPKQRIWNYPKIYSNSDVWFSDKTTKGNLKDLEDSLLEAAFADQKQHPFNVKKQSNIPQGSDGYVYIIKVGNVKSFEKNPETDTEDMEEDDKK